MGNDLMFAASALLLLCAFATVMAVIWVLCKVLGAIAVDTRDTIKYWIWQAKNKLPKDDWRDWQ